MACDTKLMSKNQTLSERKSQVRNVIEFVDELIRKSKVRVIVDKRTGAVTFAGITEQEKYGVSDACVFRLLMATGSASAKQAVARAEQLAGRGVSRQALAQGIHSHDAGASWSTHKH